MQKTQPKGSFGLSEDMMQAINDIDSKKRAPAAGPTSDVEDIVAQEETQKESPTELAQPARPAKAKPAENAELTEEEIAVKLKEVMKEVETNLGIEIDEDDIWSFLFNNEILKRGITIVPGKMVATFKTLSLDATNDVDGKMAEALDEKRLESGFKNINTQHILAQGLVELGRPGQVKSIGETPEERFKVIGKMSSLLVEKLGQKWNQFVFLIDETVKEEMETKKD